MTTNIGAAVSALLELRQWCDDRLAHRAVTHNELQEQWWRGACHELGMMVRTIDTRLAELRRAQPNPVVETATLDPQAWRERADLTIHRFGIFCGQQNDAGAKAADRWVKKLDDLLDEIVAALTAERASAQNANNIAAVANSEAVRYMKERDTERAAREAAEKWARESEECMAGVAEERDELRARIERLLAKYPEAT